MHCCFLVRASNTVDSAWLVRVPAPPSEYVCIRAQGGPVACTSSLCSHGAWISMQRAKKSSAWVLSTVTTVGACVATFFVGCAPIILPSSRHARPLLAMYVCVHWLNGNLTPALPLHSQHSPNLVKLEVGAAAACQPLLHLFCPAAVMFSALVTDKLHQSVPRFLLERCLFLVKLLPACARASGVERLLLLSLYRVVCFTCERATSAHGVAMRAARCQPYYTLWLILLPIPILSAAHTESGQCHWRVVL